MNQDELKKTLDNHEAWLIGDGGEQANLRSADLRSANLSFANLRFANLRFANILGGIGNLAELKSIFVDTYQITYTAEVLQIGCERHDIADWWGFDDKRIERMDGKALEWWKQWKPILQQIIKDSPAVPTGHVETEESEQAA